MLSAACDSRLPAPVANAANGSLGQRSFPDLAPADLWANTGLRTLRRSNKYVSGAHCCRNIESNESVLPDAVHSAPPASEAVSPSLTVIVL